MKKNLALTIMVAASLAMGTAAEAVEILSVRTADLMLCGLDSETGTVSEIGTLNLTGATITDAAAFDGKFYVLYRIDNPAVMMRLARVDPSTGFVEADVTIYYDGAVVPRAEGLAAYGGELVLSFNTSNTSRSRYIGALADDGTIEVPRLDYDEDMDSLAARGSELFAVNVKSGGPFVYRAVPQLATITSMYSVEPVHVTDFVVCGPSMIVVDNTNLQIHTLDLDSGAALASHGVGVSFRGAGLLDPSVCELHYDGFESSDSGWWTGTVGLQ